MAGYCRDCFTGTVQTDVAPTGTEQVVHGRRTYVATPGPDTAPLGTVVILTDAFGWRFPNTRTLADAYACRVPCTVYIPDFMDNNALPVHTMALLDYQPPASDLLPLRLLKRAWSLAQVIPALARFMVTCRHALAQERIVSFFRAVRTSGAPSSSGGTIPKVGAVGFCWGGFYAVELAADEEGSRVMIERDGGETEEVSLIDCAFTAHPSLLRIPRDIERVVKPLSVANGDDDEFMGRKAMVGLREVLEGKNEVAGREVHEVVVYPGAKHGFGVRRDWNDEVQREGRERSEDQAVGWMRRHFQVE